MNRELRVRSRADKQGFNVSIGDDVFIGPNATFLDVCPSESSLPFLQP